MKAAPRRARFQALAADVDALSSAHRLELLHFLVEARSADAIAEHLGMTTQAAGRHLRKLRARGLVRMIPSRSVSEPRVSYVLDGPRLFELTSVVARLGHLRVKDAPPSLAAGGLADVPHLRVVNGPDAWARFDLEGRDTVRVGRSADCDLRLWHDATVAPLHAVLRWRGRHLTMENATAARATRADGAEVPHGSTVVLPTGAVVQLGDTVLVHQRALPTPASST